MGSNCKWLVLIAIFLIIIIVPTQASFFAQDGNSDQNLKYYVQLKNEEFMNAMIPKEKYLLGLVLDIHEELKDRRSEGQTAAELGLEEIVSPQELAADAYQIEIQKIVNLIDEIELLERKAKQKVDLEALEALSQLKRYVQQIIEGGSLPEEEKVVITDSKAFDEALKEVDPEAIAKKTTEEIDPIDLFEQWKYTRLLDYKTKITKFEFLRTRLLRTASFEQEERMFKRALKRALISYSCGDFLLARLQLQDILKTFTRIPLLDDVHYFCSEASYGLNYFDEAVSGFNRLVQLYPESQFSSKALVKLVYIYYIYDEFDRISETYRQLTIRKAELDEETFGTVSYLVGYAHFKAGEYGKAIEALGVVPAQTSYFFPALYLSAACYANLDNEDFTLTIYHRLIDEETSRQDDSILKQIRNNAILKVGMIYYERGEHERAIEYFNQISQDFQHYDLSVIARAWSAYRAGKPGETLRNTQLLLKHSLVSNYAYEAIVLAASSKELLGHKEEALDDLKHVFDVGTRPEELDVAAHEDAASIKSYQSLEEERDQILFEEMDQIRSFLGKSISDDISSQDKSPVQRRLDLERQTLTERIDALDRMESQARDRGNQAMLSEIRQLRSEMIQTLDDHSRKSIQVSSSQYEDPLLERMGMQEYMRYTFRSLLMQTLREKDQTGAYIQEVIVLIEEASQQDRMDYVIRMEMKKEELQDYYLKLNQYEVWLRENTPKDFHVELEHWAAFSGYGISNINFSRIKETEAKMADISQTIDTIDRIFQAKRRNLENRIQGLLTDVAKIEDQMRMEAERKQEVEQDRFFKSEYFNRERQETVAGKYQEEPETEKKED